MKTNTKSMAKAHKQTGKRTVKTPTGKKRVPKVHRKAITPLNVNMVYTVAQMAEILQVNENTARNMLRRGEIPAKKIGQEWRILGSTIKLFLQVITVSVMEDLTSFEELPPGAVIKSTDKILVQRSADIDPDAGVLSKDGSRRG